MIEFRIDSEYNGRDFGTIFLNGENVVLGLVAAGLVHVKERGSGSDLDDLQTLQAEAVAAGRGVHSTDSRVLSNAVRVVVDSDYNLESFYQKNKGKAMHAIVERVRDAGCVQLYIMPEFQFLNLFISGVNAPRQMRNQESDQIEVEPFYHEAKYITEALLLQRDVVFYIDQIDKTGKAFGTVLSEDGNAAEEVLSRGLAATVDWSCELSVCKTGMRLAERTAREAGIGRWKDYVAPAGANRKVASGDATWQGRVVEVRSGDTLGIQRAGSNAVLTVSLSSIRCPRLGNKQREEADQPWAVEAKEFVRKELIGQTVTVKVDYQRLVGEADRMFITVVHKQRNIAVLLARAGLCESMKHRGDDERSSVYEEITEAETEAKTKKLKIHSEVKAPVHRINDHSVTAQKAKTFLPSLQRSRRVTAIVDYVAQGARVRLSIPEHSATISFALSGIKCPATARGEEKAEDFADEASLFTKLHILQREVEIEIETCDRGGSFLGSLFLNGDSLAVMLVRNGYAWLTDSADRNPYFQQLEAAEKHAKSTKLRIWEKYDEEAAQKAAAEKNIAESKATPNIVRVSTQHVVSGNSFFVHMLGEEAKPLLQVRARQFAMCDFNPPSMGDRYRVGQYCSAEDPSDGIMYRARVLRHDAGKYEIQYIDYGNTGWVTASQMQPWSGDSSTPPLAYECKLSYIKAPAIGAEYGYEAGEFMANALLGKELTAQVVGRVGEVYQLMLFDGDKSINSDALKSGLMMLTKEAKNNRNPPKELTSLFASAEHAKRSRINLWRYGDAESDDEDDFPKGKGR